VTQRDIVGELVQRYTGYVNARAQRTGHVWRSRFGVVATDEPHLVKPRSWTRCALQASRRFVTGNAILFLLSDRSLFVNRTEFLVDNGSTA